MLSSILYYMTFPIYIASNYIKDRFKRITFHIDICYFRSFSLKVYLSIICNHHRWARVKGLYKIIELLIEYVLVWLSRFKLIRTITAIHRLYKVTYIHFTNIVNLNGKVNFTRQFFRSTILSVPPLRTHWWLVL